MLQTASFTAERYSSGVVLTATFGVALTATSGVSTPLSGLMLVSAMSLTGFFSRVFLVLVVERDCLFSFLVWSRLPDLRWLLGAELSPLRDPLRCCLFAWLPECLLLLLLRGDWGFLGSDVVSSCFLSSAPLNSLSNNRLTSPFPLFCFATGTGLSGIT
jgi:hypothetical protein